MILYRCIDTSHAPELVGQGDLTLHGEHQGLVTAVNRHGHTLGRFHRDRFQAVEEHPAPTPAPPPPEAAVAPTEGLPGGVKHDAGKPRLDLLPAEALVEIGAVLGAGAEKYAPHNWRKGFAYSRLIAAALRHIFAWVGGEDKDPETGRSHLAHAACCLMFLITFEQTCTGTDDRYTN